MRLATRLSISSERRRSPTPFRSRSGSRYSTTTERCGVRSRCRSRSTSSCAGSSRWPRRAGAAERQPWKAAYERDYGWFAQGARRALRGRRHERADARGRRPRGVRRDQCRGLRGAVDAFLRSAQHPTLGRGYLQTAYAPMVELLGYLEANGFANYIASGGGRDFMRPISQEVYGIPRERVIGSAPALEYTGDDAAARSRHKAEADYLDDGPAEADPHLEPRRSPAAARRRELERRHPDARLQPAPRQAVAYACSSSTTTPTASSTTRAAPSKRSNAPTPKAGRWSASRTTGRLSSSCRHGPRATGRRCGLVTRRSRGSVGTAGRHPAGKPPTSHASSLVRDISPALLSLPPSGGTG